MCISSSTSSAVAISVAEKPRSSSFFRKASTLMVTCMGDELTREHDRHDDGGVGQLSPDHPLDHVELEIVEVVLRHKGRQVELLRGRNERLGLIFREPLLLEPRHDLVRVDHERLHRSSVYHAGR